MAYVILKKATGELTELKNVSGIMSFQSRRHAKQWARAKRIKMKHNEIMFMTSKEMERFA